MGNRFYFHNHHKKKIGKKKKFSPYLLLACVQRFVFTCSEMLHLNSLLSGVQGFILLFKWLLFLTITTAEVTWTDWLHCILFQHHLDLYRLSKLSRAEKYLSVSMHPRQNLQIVFAYSFELLVFRIHTKALHLKSIAIISLY